MKTITGELTMKKHTEKLTMKSIAGLIVVLAIITYVPLASAGILI
jgi:hypothetical protein